MKSKNLLILPFALTLLAGCRDNGAGGGNGTGGNINIVFWHNANSTSQGIFENFANQYHKEHPNVTITVEKQSGDYNALQEVVKTGIAAGDNGAWPDLFYGYPDAVADLLSSRKVVNLQTYIDDPEIGLSEEEMSDYVEAYVDQGRHYAKSGIYSMPFACSTEAMYYNKEILGKTITGVNNDQPIDTNYIEHMTWEELFTNFSPKFLEWNSKQSSDNKLLDETGEYAVLSWSSDSNAFITMCEQYGYAYTSRASNGKGTPEFNNDNVKGLLHTLKDAFDNHYFITNGSYGTGTSYTNKLFCSKKSLFDIGSTGGGQYYAGSNNEMVDVRLSKIPTAEGKNKKVILQGPSIAILKRSDTRAREAWNFYKYITSTKNCLNWSVNTGYSPLRHTVFDQPAWSNFASSAKPERTTENVYGRIAEYTPTVTNDFFTSPVFSGSNECRVQVESLVKSVLKLASWDDSQVSSLMSAAKEAAQLKCN